MDYETEEEIGRGGFGIVERAKGSDGKFYAIKTLNLGQVPDEHKAEFRRRFEREVRYQAQLDHPNVVPIVESILDEDPPWFVMPLADGSLMDEMNADRTLGGEPQVALYDILAGLEALHSQGFFHRDLKPANVLRFRKDNGDYTYMISDFGLLTPGIGHASTLTQTNMGGGTLMYRAPECANNFRRATAQADIYSFGAILHDIFGPGVQRMPHSELTVPGPLAPIVEKCTKSNSKRRYRSVSALREALFEILDQGEMEFYSEEEQFLVELLMNNDELADDQWDRIFYFVDESFDAGNDLGNIFRVLSQDHILSLFESSPDMAQGLGEMFATFAQEGVFDFGYCDVLSAKAELFFQNGDLQLRSKIALSMLVLGTSHNRWRVEHQFMRFAGPDCEDALAERIRIEIEVQDIDFDQKIAQLESSIDETRENLHPILRQILKS